jgi:hypothetical protein
MPACLVQQLFRKKINKELPPELVDEVLSPMLRSRKEYPKELLLDIKLTQKILVLEWAAKRVLWNSMSAFTLTPAYWGFDLKTSSYGALPDREGVPYHPWGKRGSKIRRRIRRSNWGTIDILNELRELNYPHIGFTRTGVTFDDAYIRLWEDNSLRPKSWLTALHNTDAIKDRKRFVNDFLEDALKTDKRLTWEEGVIR